MPFDGAVVSSQDSRLADLYLVRSTLTKRSARDEAAAMTVGWTERLPPPSGNDQLGLRESSESQYTRLIDFTTSVTWHPRYYAFLCWALREAYQRHSVTVGGQARIEEKGQREALRRADYAMAAATLAATPNLLRVIGVDKVGPALRELEPGALLEIRDDHVGQGGGAGSFGTYAGPMSNLGLLGDARPSRRGERLADAFAASLEAAGAPVFARPALSREQLTKCGEVLGLGRLTEAAATVPAVAMERETLRSAIVDFDAAQRPGMTRRRILTIGLLLALHEQAGDEPVELRHFREAILLGGLRRGGGKALELPQAYTGIVQAWHLYQVHANAVLALEAFLSLALEAVRRDGRASVPREEALDQLAAWARHGWSASEFPPALALEPEEPIGTAVSRLGPILEKGWRAPAAEPELAALLEAQWPSLRHPALAAAAAASLFVATQARLRAAQATFESAWLKPTVEAWRLPPAVLVADLTGAENEGHSVTTYLRHVAGALAISAHAMNARRKLVFQPGTFTARLTESAGRLEYIASHRPGTSSPRFDNAVWYLEALGYLAPVGHAGARLLTDDGRVLAAECNRQAEAWS